MLWIVLPAYNEAESLPSLLPKIHTCLSEAKREFHIVVVNDGSVDGTAEILERFSKSMPLTEIRHVINRGLGETERDGFEYAALQASDDDLIVRVEGDDTHDPRYIFMLLAKLDEGYDVVNTSRFQPGGDQKGVDGYRAFISRCANRFMRIVFQVPGILDYSCGFRAYRARVIRDAIRIFGNNFIQLKGLGFTSTLEMIVKLKILGCRFAEVPFVLRYDQKKGSSKMVSSITSMGYIVMGLLYHWPFGGWHSQYKGLAQQYREDREAAIREYGLKSIKLSTTSRVSL